MVLLLLLTRIPFSFMTNVENMNHLSPDSYSRSNPTPHWDNRYVSSIGLLRNVPGYVLYPLVYRTFDRAISRVQMSYNIEHQWDRGQDHFYEIHLVLEQHARFLCYLC